MGAPKPVAIPDTKVLLAGVDFNIAAPQNLQTLRGLGVRKVFMLFPLTQKQFEERSEFKEGLSHPSLEQVYAKWGIDPLVVAKLMKEGIFVSSLIRNPSSLRDYESFNKEAIAVKGKFLLQCIHGRHASASYAMYYLARSSNFSYHQITDLFARAGLGGRDLNNIESFLGDAKVNVRRVVEERERAAIAQKKSIERHARKMTKKHWGYKGHQHHK